LGRDIIKEYIVRQQIKEPQDAPFAHREDLGWVLVVREVCVGNAHKPSVSTFKTNVVENGRPFYLTPCESVMQRKEKLSFDGELLDRPSNRLEANTKRTSEHNLGHTAFNNTENDNKLAPSIENTVFLKTMDKEVYWVETYNWVDPLPIRVSKKLLPNNRGQALSRLTSLFRTLDTHERKSRHLHGENLRAQSRRTSSSAERKRGALVSVDLLCLPSTAAWPNKGGI